MKRVKTKEREAGVAPFNYFFQFKVPPKMYETILLTVGSIRTSRWQFRNIKLNQSVLNQKL